MQLYGILTIGREFNVHIWVGTKIKEIYECVNDVSYHGSCVTLELFELMIFALIWKQMQKIQFDYEKDWRKSEIRTKSY